jgi:hypothetical protein
VKIVSDSEKIVFSHKINFKSDLSEHKEVLVSMVAFTANADILLPPQLSEVI